MSTALLCINLINDYVHPDGKLAKQGILDFAEKYDVLQRVARIQEHFREQGCLVIHTRTGFSEGYPEFPKDSQVFKDFKQKGALQLETWGTEFHETVTPRSNEPIINKHRCSSFYRTRLELILQTQNIKKLYIVGYSTMRTVELTAREAHDRDFHAVVIQDGCVDSSDERHEMGLKLIGDCAEVKDFKDIAIRLAMGNN